MMKLTSAELDIMQILWKSSPLSVKDINDLLNAKKTTGYTTTLKIMQI
ncbi:MAG: BlaI/MecI/CopY family transcriptional regulator [Bacteroidales bacterium]|nr:BlaI/MecI/CopY family transcriptional regulator [Bacteroidales bacterium]